LHRAKQHDGVYGSYYSAVQAFSYGGSVAVFIDQQSQLGDKNGKQQDSQQGGISVGQGDKSVHFSLPGIM
jgi:hypothetical protein